MSKRRFVESSPGAPRRRARRTPGPASFPALEAFARRLESLRLERGLTQRALAARAGISANHYADIAHAEANPTVIVLLGLARALGVSLDDLFDSSSLPAAGECRTVLVADLKQLAASYEQLADVVNRLLRRYHLSV